MKTSIAEDGQYLGDLRKRSRPAMDEEQRYGIRFRRCLVHEVHFQIPEVLYLNMGGKLRQFIQSRFLMPPVIARPPELD